MRRAGAPRRASAVAVVVCTALAMVAAGCSEPPRSGWGDNSNADSSSESSDAATGVDPDDAPASTTTTTTSTSTTTTLVPPTPEDPPLPERPALAGIDVPCGPAAQPSPSAPTETGVDQSTFSIATGSDQGGLRTASSGRGAPEAVIAMAGWCNSVGGLAGRQLVVRNDDVAVVEVAERTQQQCDEVFAIVGHVYLLDEEARGARQECGLPAFSARGVASSVDPSGLAIHGHVAALMVDETATVVALLGFDTEGGRAAQALRVSALGSTDFVVAQELLIDPTAVPEWRSIAASLSDLGVGQVMVDAPCRDVVVPLAQAAEALSYRPVFVMTDSGYDRDCLEHAAAADVDLDRLVVEIAFLPAQDGADAPATTAYAEILDQVLAPVTGDALHAAAAFWQFADAVAGCRSTLTRACVAEESVAADGFGAGKLLSVDVACRVVLGVEGSSFVRLLPTESGQRACGPEFVASVPGLGFVDVGG